MENLVIKLEHQVNIDIFRNEVLNFYYSHLAEINASGTKQIMLSCVPGVEDYNFFGVGSISHWKINDRLVIQNDFSRFNPELADSYIESIWKQFPLKVGRVRIMALEAGRCYSVHTDTENRIHIAVQTNQNCLMLYKNHPTWYHIPDDGHMYEFNGIKLHTAINNSSDTRIHVVWDLI